MRKLILMAILLLMPAMTTGCDDRARIREERAVDRMGVLYRRCVRQNGFTWSDFEKPFHIDCDSKCYSSLYLKCLNQGRARPYAE